MTYNFDTFIDQNPWRVDEKTLNFPYFPREILAEIKPHLLTPEPLLIKGGHGTGKTALLHSVIRELIINEHQDSKSIFYFNLDDPLTADFFTHPEDVQKFLTCFSPSEATRIFLIIDEAQYLPATTREQLLLQNNLKLICSSEQMTISSPSEKPFQVFDFGACKMKEFLNATLPRQNYYLPEIKGRVNMIQIGEGYSKILSLYFEEYVIYGGYPQTVKLMQPRQKQKVLGEIIGDCFKSIARDTGGIDEPNKFVNLLSRLAAKNGQLLNIQEISREVGVDHRKARRYLEIMINHFLVSLVYQYRTEDFNKEVQQGAPLIYFNDTGIRNTLLNAFDDLKTRTDRMLLLDNLLYRELSNLSKISKLSFWRTATGLVAFSFTINGKLNLASNRYELPRSKYGMKALMNFTKKVKPERLIILTCDYLPAEQYRTEINGTRIIYLPTYWLWTLPEIVAQ